MGKLIVFEGTDGSGKSTQFNLLCSRLQEQGTQLVLLEISIVSSTDLKAGMGYLQVLRSLLSYTRLQFLPESHFWSIPDFIISLRPIQNLSFPHKKGRLLKSKAALPFGQFASVLS